MLELTWKGTKPLTLPNGETRKFLQVCALFLSFTLTHSLSLSLSFTHTHTHLSPIGL